MKKFLIFALILSLMCVPVIAEDDPVTEGSAVELRHIETVPEKNMLAVVGVGYDDDVTFTTSFGRKIGGIYVLPTVQGGKYESVGLDLVYNIPLFVIPGLGTVLSLSPIISAGSESSELFDENGNPITYGTVAGGTGIKIGIPGAEDSSLLLQYKRKDDLKKSAFVDRDFWNASYVIAF